MTHDTTRALVLMGGNGAALLFWIQVNIGNFQSTEGTVSIVLAWGLICAMIGLATAYLSFEEDTWAGWTVLAETSFVGAVMLPALMIAVVAVLHANGHSPTEPIFKPE